MKSVRINVSLPVHVYDALSKEAPQRQRSRFICEAIQLLIEKKKAAKLASEYREAASEIRRVNLEMEGAVNDGLD